MKRFLAVLLALVCTFALIGCAKEAAPATEAPAAEEPVAEEPAAEEPAAEEPAAEEPAAEEPAAEEPAAEEPAAEEPTTGEPPVATPAVMTYEMYAAAALDTPVVVETYVQATQSWWEDKITAYTQDEDGAYFLYNMACSEEDAAKLVPGTKIRVSGFKAEWSGEVEIIDATFEIIEGSYIATPVDATAWLGTDELIAHQNQLVSFKGMTVAASKDADGNEVPFLYNWDGSGEDGNDLYFNVTLGDATYTFTVESYLCDKTTDVYAAVKALNIGDKIDAEGFLYWYEGANPHITAVTPAA